MQEREVRLLRLHHELIRAGIRVRVRKLHNGRWKLTIRSPETGWSETVLCAGAGAGQGEAEAGTERNERRDSLRRPPARPRATRSLSASGRAAATYRPRTNGDGRELSLRWCPGIPRARSTGPLGFAGHPPVIRR
jgi:hypothetical protein